MAADYKKHSICLSRDRAAGIYGIARLARQCASQQEPVRLPVRIDLREKFKGISVAVDDG